MSRDLPFLVVVVIGAAACAGLGVGGIALLKGPGPLWQGAWWGAVFGAAFFTIILTIRIIYTSQETVRKFTRRGCLTGIVAVPFGALAFFEVASQYEPGLRHPFPVCPSMMIGAAVGTVLGFLLGSCTCLYRSLNRKPNPPSTDAIMHLPQFSVKPLPGPPANEGGA